MSSVCTWVVTLPRVARIRGQNGCPGLRRAAHLGSLVGGLCLGPECPAPHRPSCVVPAGACRTGQVSSTGPRRDRCPPLPCGPMSPTRLLMWLMPQYIWGFLRVGLEENAEVRDFCPTQSCSKRRASARAGLGRPAGTLRGEPRGGGSAPTLPTSHSVGCRTVSGPCSLTSPWTLPKQEGQPFSCRQATCQRRTPGPVGTTGAASAVGRREGRIPTRPPHPPGGQGRSPFLS